MSTHLKKLTDRQIVEFALTKPKTPDELWNYVRVLFNISIPRKAVTEDASAPFTAFAEAYFATAPISVWIGSRGTGKAQPLDALLLTPEGYQEMRETKIGDLVFDADGNPVSVLAVHPQGVKPIYRVIFNDRTSTLCCGEHLWRARMNGRISKGPRKGQLRDYKVLRTTELQEDLTWPRGDFKWRIPVVEEVQFPKKDLPLNPYILGVLLGDGSMTASGCPFTKSVRDKELLQKVKRLLPSGAMLVSDSSKRVHRLIRKAGLTQNPVVTELKRLGLRKCAAAKKFIPRDYLFSSPAQRWALLHGLMDTDGCPGDTSGVDFCSASEQLFADVIFLVQSLGGTATVSATKIVDDRPYYRCYIKTPKNPFSLKRKAKKWKPPTKYPVTRIPVAIEPAGEAECQCITVDSPTSTYLTNDCIVTHNSFLLALLASVELLTLRCNISVLAGSREQSERVLKYLRNEDSNIAGLLWGAPNAPRMLINEDQMSKKAVRTVKGLLGNEDDPGFEILAHAASETSIRGGHMSRLRFDELDVGDYEAVESSRGCTSPVRDVRTQTVYSSTYHRYGGTMSKILREAKEKGWPVHTWSYREVMQSNGGFMSDEFIKNKRAELSQAQWDAEYENKGPQGGVRVFDKSHLDQLFNKRLGNIPGHENQHWKLYPDDEVKTGRFYHGGDWAREEHWTVLHTFQRTASGCQTAAWYRTNQKPYPQIIREVVAHIKEYRGPLAHDATGVGKALDDLLVEGGLRRPSVFPVEWTRQKLVREMATFYQHAIENGEIVGPFIQFAYSEHEYLTEDMLRGSAHCPDSVAAAFMAYWLMRQNTSGRSNVIMRIS